MNKHNIWSVDWGLIIPTLILLMLSLTALFSISSSFFKTQLFFVGISILIFFIFSNVNYKIIQFYKVHIYAVSIVLLFLVLILGIGSHGSVRWFEFLGFRIQFSEILKPFLAVSFSAFLASRKNLNFSTLATIGLLLFPIVFLIFLQPDLGDALIYFIVTILTLIIVGYPFRFFLAGIIFLSSIIPIFWHFLHTYQRQRISSFINPNIDPLGTSYNSIQSIIAIGSGMILGKGFGQGTQSSLRFLPEHHTDFIFATITEDLGFVGTLIILVTFGFLLYRIFVIFKNSDDRFSKTFSSVVFFIILVQFFANVGMNSGLLPVVGITLPFVSYGGSSLLSNFIILGLLSSISKSLKDREIIEIK
jgi:rod shape determining protein RodA